MAIIQQGQRRDNSAQNMSAIANIIMQVMNYKQQQDATAYEQARQKEVTDYSRAQQEGYGKDVGSLLAPYRQPDETREPTDAERFSDALSGVNREQLDSMLAPPKQSFDLYPTAHKGGEFDRNLNAVSQRRDAARLRAAMGRAPDRRVPGPPRYNIKPEQMPGIQAGLLEAGSKRPRNVRMNSNLSSMFGSTGGSGGSGGKRPLIKHVDAQQRVAYLNPYTARFVEGDKDFDYTSAKAVSMTDFISSLGGRKVQTKASQQRQQNLLEATDKTILQAIAQAKKMRNYNKVNANGKMQMVEGILAKQGFKMPREKRK